MATPIYTVIFENVGRGKVSWQQDMEHPSFVALSRAIKKKKALASKGIDFSYDVVNDDETRGTIFAGFRAVGTFRVVSGEARAALESVKVK
jgi:hypothetical protein